MSHTPGPWLAGPYYIENADGKVVIKTENIMTIANARLIAAAPDMLQVLKFLTCIDFENFTEHDELLLESVREDAQAAIAKATGSA